MKRNELLRNPEWWLANIQNDLYAIIYKFMEKNKLKKKDIADMLGVLKRIHYADIKRRFRS